MNITTASCIPVSPLNHWAGFRYFFHTAMSEIISLCPDLCETAVLRVDVNDRGGDDRGGDDRGGDDGGGDDGGLRKL